jgi:hypothetical protein
MFICDLFSGDVSSPHRIQLNYMIFCSLIEEYVERIGRGLIFEGVSRHFQEGMRKIVKYVYQDNQFSCRSLNARDPAHEGGVVIIGALF